MRGSASGRLDLLGGVADYSGALVLEMPTRQGTEVVATPDDAFVVGPVSFSVAELVDLAGLAYEDVRRQLAACPRWTHYVVGVALVLVRHGVIAPPRVRLDVTSDLPASVGVASSAALEVATARALGAADADPLRVAALCQEAENHVVGAPCGIMDQVAVALGTPGAVLPILCRPASVGGPGPPAARARGRRVADGNLAQRGRRAVRAGTGGGLHGQARARGSGRPHLVLGERAAAPPLWSGLPTTMDGASFLNRWGTTDDDVTVVRPDETYPVRAAASFGVEEHVRRWTRWPRWPARCRRRRGSGR